MRSLMPFASSVLAAALGFIALNGGIASGGPALNAGGGTVRADEHREAVKGTGGSNDAKKEVLVIRDDADVRAVDADRPGNAADDAKYGADGKDRGKDPDTAASPGFDRYPARTYSFLFNNVLSNLMYRPTTPMLLLTVPVGTVPSSVSLESGYSLLIRLSNYPINLLYDRIGVGWTSLIMAAKIVLLDFPFAYTMKVLNHEYSGHASRFHEAGQFVDRITIGVPLPYGEGGGATAGTIPSRVDRGIMIDGAGSEANTVMAHQMSLRWVSDGYIYPFDILLYFNARFDQLLYINVASRGLPPFMADGDWEQYIAAINRKYGSPYPFYRLKLGDLKRWSYIALADPFLYMATGALFYNFFTGKRSLETLMIPLGGKAGMMPSTRVSYTPNGPECYVDFFFRLPDRSVLLVYARGGARNLRETWGGGVRLARMDLGRFIELGGGLELFSQPALSGRTDSDYYSNGLWNLYPLVNPAAYTDILNAMDIANGSLARRRARLFGGAGFIELALKANRLFRAHLRLGYKSDGYAMGLPLERGFFWHAGMGFTF